MKRRAFLGTGGALVVAFAWRPGWSQGDGGAGGSGSSGAPLPGSLKKLPWIDGWIRIDAQNRVTVFTGKAELGQGIKTALIQVAADALVVDPSRVAIVTADTERTADEGYTAGSHSMQDSGTAIRAAAAQARALLLGAAADRWSIDVAQLHVDDGVVVSGDRRATYGELVADRSLHVEASPTPAAAPRDPKSHTISGRSMHRVDIPAKVTGGVAYVQDLRPAGMVHARVVRPPSPRAALTSFDATATERMPGVIRVVRDGRFVAVVAGREYEAIVASRTLADGATWRSTDDLPPPDRLYDAMRAARAEPTTILERSGAAGTPVKTLTATYRRPYQMHGSIGPSCAIARCDTTDDGARYTVWTHTQGVYPLRKALAEMLSVDESRVHCIHVEGSGCYGHNGADDVAADAALLARALPGRPVRVQWMREDEHAWEPYGPPMIVDARASLDATGAIVDWRYEVASNTHSTRPGKAGDLLAATMLEKPFAPSPPKPLPLPEGGGDRNAIPLYALPNATVVHRFLPDMPLRVSALRSLGAYMNVFSIESFVDELARAAAVDPVEFRLRHLDDGRAKDVIREAAERFGWSDRRRAPLRGNGFAFARYKNLAGYLAVACEVEVHRDTGTIRIVRVQAAVDGGEIVNPDGVRNQVEGGIVQASSWTTIESVAFDPTRVTSRDWGGYPIARFTQIPDRIDVHLVDRPGMPFLGIGEVAQGPTAAAIANAVADATGVRIRDLPLDRERVRAMTAG